MALRPNIVRATLVITLALSSCIKGPGLFKKDSTATSASPMGSPTITDGVQSGVYNPASQGTQLLEVSSGAIDGAALALPSGALNIATTISIQEGGSLTGGVLASSLTSGTDLTSGGPSIMISAAPPANTSSPMSLRLPISLDALGLADEEIFYSVIYKVKDEDTGEYFSGLILDSEFEVQTEKFIVIQTKRFGAFQVALSTKKIETATEIAVTTPILTAKEELAHEEVTFSASEASFNEDTREVNWSVATSGFSTIVSCVAAYHSDKSTEAISVETLDGIDVANNTTIVFSFTETSNAAVTVYARFRCEDDLGYSAESEWTEGYDIIESNLEGVDIDNPPVLGTLNDETALEMITEISVDIDDVITGLDEDEDGQPIAYSCILNNTVNGFTAGDPCADVSAAIDPATGVFTWTPPFNMTDHNSTTTYSFKIIATANSVVTFETLDIEVEDTKILITDFTLNGGTDWRDVLTYDEVPQRLFDSGDSTKIRGICDNVTSGMVYTLQGEVQSTPVITCTSGVFEQVFYHPTHGSNPRITDFYGRKTLEVKVTDSNNASAPVDDDYLDLYYSQVAATPIAIANENELDSLLHGDEVADSSSFFYLTNNIDLSLLTQWYPARDKDAPEDSGCTTGLAGVFEGNGFSINNMTLDYDSRDSEIGFFCGLSGHAVVSNLVMTQTDIYEPSGTRTNVGGVAGVFMSSCAGCAIVNTNIQGTVSAYAGLNVGGLVGHIDDDNGYVVNSTSDVVVTGQDAVGGIVGRITNGNGALVINRCTSINNVHGYGSGDNVGGIAGFVNNSIIRNVKNSGDVEGVSTANIGGVIGRMEHVASSLQESAAVNVTVTGDSNSVGGLIGYMSDGTISDSFATGNVTGLESVGGLVGQIQVATATILRSYTTADVELNSNTGFGGGIIGTAVMMNSSTLLNSFAFNTVRFASSGDVNYHGGVYGAFDASTCSISNDCADNVFWNDAALVIPSSACNSGPSNDGCTGGGVTDITDFQDDDSHAVFANWDFDDIWTVNTGDFPTLLNLP